jgi:carbohydrate-selective porin OprB
VTHRSMLPFARPTLSPCIEPYKGTRNLSCASRKNPIAYLTLALLGFAWPLYAQPAMDGNNSNPLPVRFDAARLPIELPSRQYLLSDWASKRSVLSEKGIDFDFFYIADLLANPAGGLEQTQAGWERIRGTIDVNFDHDMRWKGLRFHATGLWQTGPNLGAKIGVLANPSDLVSSHTTRLELGEGTVKARSSRARANLKRMMQA